MSIFGSARTRPNNPYYKLGVEVSHALSEAGYGIITGGGPGIMEAANRGASDVDAESIGLNIVLPHEQAPNSYITPDLCFQFHYFAIRKM
ncbi:MAG: TIGR00730 family Rossman fold protein, partial [Myxococcota bacterium]